VLSRLFGVPYGEIVASLASLSGERPRGRARERDASDWLAVRAWHVANRSQRAIARAYWAIAAASVTVDDAKIGSLAERLKAA
jgi:hypothetical protein